MLGLVVEVFGRRRIFVPMTRVTNIDSGQVITTGLLNMRRFEQRPTETLVIGQLLDRTVTIREHRRRAAPSTTSAMEQARTRDWVLTRVARPGAGQGASRRRGQTHVVEWRDVERAAPRRGDARAPTHLLAALDELRRPTPPA